MKLYFISNVSCLLPLSSELSPEWFSFSFQLQFWITPILLQSRINFTTQEKCLENQTTVVAARVCRAVVTHCRQIWPVAACLWTVGRPGATPKTPFTLQMTLSSCPGEASCWRLTNARIQRTHFMSNRWIVYGVLPWPNWRFYFFNSICRFRKSLEQKEEFLKSVSSSSSPSPLREYYSRPQKLTPPVWPPVIPASAVPQLPLPKDAYNRPPSPPLDDPSPGLNNNMSPRGI